MDSAECDHGLDFPRDGSAEQHEAMALPVPEVRKRWPRLMGACPKGCGYSGIGYASYAHYIAGDW